MRSFSFVLVFLLLSWSRVAAADTFNAEGMTSESDPSLTEANKPHPADARRRRDPALFAAGITTAVAGGIAMNVGALLVLAGGATCAGATCRDGHVIETDEGMVVGGLVTMAVGVLMVAAGIPMAVSGGRKEPATTKTATGVGLIPVLTF